MMRFPLIILLGLLAAFALRGGEACAQSAMKKANELIRKQEPPLISPRVLERITPQNAEIRVSLRKQRAYLMVREGGEIAIDTPISSGKAAGMTPTGKFKVQERDADHRSNLYGNFVDAKGRVVRAGVSVRIDSAPSGTRFEGAPMRWFLRVHGAVGIHAGQLPGYPASHGCIRLPEEVAKLIFERTKVGTPVIIEK